MGFVLPTGIRDPFQLMPAGQIPMAVTKVRTELVGKNDDGTSQGLFCLVISMVVQGIGTPWDGITHDEYFTIGDAGDTGRGIAPDPKAQDPATWVRRAGNLKQMIQDGMEIAFEGAELEQVLAQVVGRSVLVTVQHVPEPAMKKNKPNQYAGRVRANIQKFNKIAGATPQVDEAGMQRAQEQSALIKPSMGQAPGLLPPPPPIGAPTGPVMPMAQGGGTPTMPAVAQPMAPMQQQPVAQPVAQPAGQAPGFAQPPGQPVMPAQGQVPASVPGLPR